MLRWPRCEQHPKNKRPAVAGRHDATRVEPQTTNDEVVFCSMETVAATKQVTLVLLLGQDRWRPTPTRHLQACTQTPTILRMICTCHLKGRHLATVWDRQTRWNNATPKLLWFYVKTTASANATLLPGNSASASDSTTVQGVPDATTMTCLFIM
jgi:hypothetical protein